MCKKQGVVSHSSTEAEVVSLETAIRLEGVPALLLWETILDTLHPVQTKNKSSSVRCLPDPFDVDFVPPTVVALGSRAILKVLEDNDAVIKMTLKRRSPIMRHVQRT